MDRRRRGAAAPPLSWPYRRLEPGVWAYEWGGVVPGARDLTLRLVYAFAPMTDVRGRPCLAVPLATYDADARLAWCAAYWDPRSSDETILVPVVAWDAHDESVGMDAPELAVTAVLDTTAVARLAGLSPRTVSVQLARGLIPPPVARLGGSPVWPRPLIEHWLQTRPGRPGRPPRHLGDPHPARHRRPGGLSASTRSPTEPIDVEDDEDEFAAWERRILGEDR